MLLYQFMINLYFAVETIIGRTRFTGIIILEVNCHIYIHFVVKLTNQNYIHKNVESILNSGNAL